MFDELVKAVRLHLSERLTSPLFGAVAVSWCAWNYRVILVFLSSEPVLAKLWIVDHLLYPSAGRSLLTGIIAPLITSALYLFVYPYPAKWVYTFTRKRQREILEVRRKIEDETPLTLEDSRRIRNELARAEQSYFSELETKDGEIDKLKAQLAALQQQLNVSVLPGKKEADEPKLTAELCHMLEIIEGGGGKVTVDAAIKRSGVSRTQAEFRLGELRKRGLVLYAYDPSVGSQVFKFTHEGRAALIEYRKKTELANQDP